VEHRDGALELGLDRRATRGLEPDRADLVIRGGAGGGQGQDESGEKRELAELHGRPPSENLGEILAQNRVYTIAL